MSNSLPRLSEAEICKRFGISPETRIKRLAELRAETTTKSWFLRLALETGYNWRFGDGGGVICVGEVER